MERPATHSVQSVCNQKVLLVTLEGGLIEVFLCGRVLGWNQSCFLEFSLFQNIKDALLPVQHFRQVSCFENNLCV